ncbi:MAG: DNA-directed RNA polymerase subunit omega [Lachnospiraceae bacterium]|nr:DNA-directed RNA polymerase subunit omega [Lachnospiraceae bacterium]
MIHPSYVDLMKVVNQGVEENDEPVISSRYSIVMATARRARQLVAGDEPLVEDAEGRKALSVAVEELNNNKIKILTDEEKAAMEERMAEEARAMKKHGREEEGAETGEEAQEAEAPAGEEASDETAAGGETDAEE